MDLNTILSMESSINNLKKALLNEKRLFIEKADDFELLYGSVIEEDSDIKNVICYFVKKENKYYITYDYDEDSYMNVDYFTEDERNEEIEKIKNNLFEISLDNINICDEVFDEMALIEKEKVINNYAKMKDIPEVFVMAYNNENSDDAYYAYTKDEKIQLVKYNKNKEKEIIENYSFLKPYIINHLYDYIINL